MRSHFVPQNKQVPFSKTVPHRNQNIAYLLTWTNLVPERELFYGQGNHALEYSVVSIQDYRCNMSGRFQRILISDPPHSDVETSWHINWEIISYTDWLRLHNHILWFIVPSCSNHSQKITTQCSFIGALQIFKEYGLGWMKQSGMAHMGYGTRVFFRRGSTVYTVNSPTKASGVEERP